MALSWRCACCVGEWRSCNTLRCLRCFRSLLPALRWRSHITFTVISSNITIDTRLAGHATPSPMPLMRRIPRPLTSPIPASPAKWCARMWRRSEWVKPSRWPNPPASVRPRRKERGNASQRGSRTLQPYCRRRCRALIARQRGRARGVPHGYGCGRANKSLLGVRKTARRAAKGLFDGMRVFVPITKALS